MQGGTASGLWQLMEDHGTNAGGKVRAYLAGEVHATTTIAHAASGIVQIAHGTNWQAEGSVQLGYPSDPTYIVFQVSKDAIIGREYTIINDRVKTAPSSRWMIPFPNPSIRSEPARSKSAQSRSMSNRPTSSRQAAAKPTLANRGRATRNDKHIAGAKTLSKSWSSGSPCNSTPANWFAKPRSPPTAPPDLG